MQLSSPETSTARGGLSTASFGIARDLGQSERGPAEKGKERGFSPLHLMKYSATSILQAGMDYI